MFRSGNFTITRVRSGNTLNLTGMPDGTYNIVRVASDGTVSEEKDVVISGGSLTTMTLGQSVMAIYDTNTPGPNGGVGLGLGGAGVGGGTGVGGRAGNSGSAGASGTPGAGAVGAGGATTAGEGSGGASATNGGSSGDGARGGVNAAGGRGPNGASEETSGGGGEPPGNEVDGVKSCEPALRRVALVCPLGLTRRTTAGVGETSPDVSVV